MGIDHTSRTGIQDDGCAWTERADSVEAVLRIPGLRGQPSGSLSVDATPTSCTVSSFGMAVWSCLLKGKANPESVAVDISDGADAIPTIELRVGKAEGSSGRWGGFIESIGEDASCEHRPGRRVNAYCVKLLVSYSRFALAVRH